MKTALKTILVATALVGMTAVAHAKEYTAVETTKETFYTTTKQDVGSENTTNRAYGNFYNSFSNDYRQPEPLASGYVIEVQQELAAQGYYKGDIDGLWGTETMDAVREYQEARGLPVTGRLSAADLQRMGITYTDRGVAQTTTTHIYSSDIDGRPHLRD
jgi:hypothetical protein